MAINRQVAGLILLAALEFAEGDRMAAKRYLKKAAVHADFEETLDGMKDAAEDEDDDFMSDDEKDGDEGDGDSEVAAATNGGPDTADAAQKTTDIDGGDSPGDTDNDDPQLRPVVASAEAKRRARTRKNLTSLARAA